MSWCIRHSKTLPNPAPFACATSRLVSKSRWSPEKKRGAAHIVNDDVTATHVTRGYILAVWTRTRTRTRTRTEGGTDRDTDKFAGFGENGEVAAAFPCVDGRSAADEPDKRPAPSRLFPLPAPAAAVALLLVRMLARAMREHSAKQAVAKGQQGAFRWLIPGR